MTDLWTSIPLGTVPQRSRPAAPASPSTPAPAGAVVPSRAVTPDPAPALDAVTVRLDASHARSTALLSDTDAPTNRLGARALAAHATAIPAPRAAPTRQPPPPSRSAAAPARQPALSGASRPTTRWVPLLALLSLLVVIATVLLPWSGAMPPWVAAQPVGLALLGAAALLAVPVTIDLLAGRVRGSALVLALPLMAGAALVTIAVAAPGRGGSVTTTLAQQGLDPNVTAAPAALGVALALCLGIGIVATVRSLKQRNTTGAGAAAVVVGVCTGVSLGAASALAIALAAPAPQVATSTAAAPAGTTSSPAAPPCPSEAASTLPAAGATAVVVGHSARVHVALCRAPSGALYYYGADDRTHLTITLPATRSEDSWIAQNNGVTYTLTGSHLGVDRGATVLADEDLTPGWAR
jgi:hypothetical protein